MTVEKLVKRMIESALRDLKVSSASPEHTNTVAEPPIIESVNIDKEIEKLIQDSVEESKVPTRKDAGKKSDKKSNNKEQLFNQVIGDAQNPAAVASKLFSFLPHTVIIAIILQSPEILDAFIKELTRPGGALDQRFKRDIPKEVEQFLTREIQKSTQIGRRSISIQSVDGFSAANNGKLSSNTLQQLRDSGGIGIGKTAIGLNEKSQGLK